MTDHSPSDAERRAKLCSWSKDIRIGLFTTQQAKGHLHSRPMTLQNQDLHEDAIWHRHMRGSLLGP
ncbi:hypothetical protein [Roseateles sp.]|uniref:hypothetical protein n=1 Tax=Roseateles sp. TaxID=1971397 RepID=UPI0031DA5D9C